MYGENYWDRSGEKRMREFMASRGIPEDKVDEIISEMDDVVSEVRWEAKEDGRFDESFYHVCNPD